MRTTALATGIPEEVIEIIRALQTTYTTEEIDAIYEDWLNTLTFSPDYIIN